MVISDFQLAVIAVGAFGVAAVFAYNKWLERRYFRQLERDLGGSPADAPREPRLGGEDEGFLPGDEPEARVEPIAFRAQEEASADDFADDEPSAPPMEPAMPLVHPAADFVVPFEAVEPIAAQQLLAAAGEALAGVDKPVRFLGWNEVRKVWQAADDHGEAASAQWRVALQLVDRRGPVSAQGVEAFVAGIRRLGDSFMAVTDLPDRGEILHRAQELDQFCAGVDVQIGLHLVPNDPAGFPGTKLRGIAEAVGMSLDQDGLFHAHDDNGHELYTMGNLDPARFAAETMTSLVSHGLTFNLDVPRVMGGGAAFGSMLTAARQLAAGLNGTVVDDNRIPLQQKGLEVIRAKVLEFQDAMSQRGISAGSATALRLFS